MVENWQQQYLKLTEFIAGHTEINIGEGIVQVPKNTRDDFYKLFNAVRLTFIENTFPDLVMSSQIMIENYRQAEKTVISLLKLRDTCVPLSFGRFLGNLKEELTRGLFYLLFDLIKHKIDLKVFEARALQDIKVTFINFSQFLYEKWIVLSLINLLRGDQLFEVKLRKLSSSDLWKQGRVLTDNVPKPQESKNLRFNEYSLENCFVVPDVIFHSALINRYISFRSEIGKSLIIATNACEKREWYPVDQVSLLGTGLTLVYLADFLEEISLIADAKRICRPDLIIGWTGQKEAFEKDVLEKVKYHSEILKPKLGTFLIYQETIPNNNQKALKDNIHVLNVGFEISKLGNIVTALSRKGIKE